MQTYKAEGYRVAGDIVDDVCASSGICEADLLGRSRLKTLVAARHLAMARVREETCLSLQEIGYVFDRDHTTIMHALRKFNG